MGIEAEPPRWPAHKAAIVRLYGIAAFAWRIVVCVGLIIAAEALFAGVGVVFAVVAVLLWLGFPLVRFTRFLVKGTAHERPSIARLALAVGTVAALVALWFTVVPWPGSVSAPAVVRYVSPSVVRTETDGFVAQIHVEPGEFVRAGQALVTLGNRDLQLQQRDLQLAIAQSRLRSRSHHRHGNVAAQQAEEKTRIALESRSQQKQQELDALTVRAPVDGQIVKAELDSLLGQYVPRGTPLVVIADESRKEAPSAKCSHRWPASGSAAAPKPRDNQRRKQLPNRTPAAATIPVANCLVAAIP